MSEEEIQEDDAVQMIYEDQVEQQELDTIRKLENREEHSVCLLYTSPSPRD